jgi:hypothetical protein
MNGNSEVQRSKAGRRFYPSSTITLILERISAGMSVAEACENPAFPCASTFYDWMARDVTLRNRVDAARAEAESRNALYRG